MTELIDASGDALIFRRPNGSTLLDTRERQPAQLGRQTVAGTLQWPSPPGAGAEARFASGGLEYRYVYPAGSRSYTVDIGAAPSGYVPNFVMSNIKLTRTESTNIFGFIYASMQVRHAEWRTMNMGSVWVEYIRTSSANDTPIAHRHLNLAIESGRWVFKLFETSRAHATSWGGWPLSNPTANATATFGFDLDLAWGVFDL